MKKLIIGMFAALAAVNVWATASVTWSLGGAFDHEPSSGVWVDTSEGGEQIVRGHLYLCFTTPGSGEDMISQLTSLSSNSGLENAGVNAMTTFLAANSQWNGYNAGNPNFSANCGGVPGMTGGEFGTCPYPDQESPSVVTIDGIDQNKAYDVAAIIFDTQDITADSKYVVIKGYGEQDFYMDSNNGQLEVGFGTEWNDGDIDRGMAAPNNSVDGQWHLVGTGRTIISIYSYDYNVVVEDATDDDEILNALAKLDIYGLLDETSDQYELSNGTEYWEISTDYTYATYIPNEE